MSVLLVVLLGALQGQDQTPLPKEPIRDFRYRLNDLRHDPKTNLDIEEVTLILEGKEAVPRSLVKDKEVFDLKGIDARYFTTPSAKEPSREVKVKADRGVLDKGARTLKLDDNVSVVRKGDPKMNETDTVLLTPSALLHFNLKYECPVCRKIFGAPGHCPEHGELLRETTITSVETDREFELTGPDGILSGRGLVTDDAIRRDYHIAHDGYIEFSGDLPGTTEKTAPAEPRTIFTQVFSRGPLAIVGPLDARTIHGEGGVRVDRIDLSETMTLQSETLTLDTVRRWDLSPSGPIDVLKLDAKGDVVLDGVSFTDGESFHATSDTLLRTVTESPKPGEPPADVTVMTAQAPRVVSLTRGLSRIDSRKVTIRKAPEGGHGTSVFEDVVRSDLLSGTQHFNLACGTLVTFASPNSLGKTEIQRLEATDHVVLGGLMGTSSTPAQAPGAESDPGEARADYFEWDMTVNRGHLEARTGDPFVRITQGTSKIMAPLVLLESQDIMVLKGPKSVRLVQEHDGKKDEYRATCDGDMVIDNSPEHHRLLMRNRCVLRTSEMLLNSDRINAILSPDGKGLESLLALGNVHAIRETDQSTGAAPSKGTGLPASEPVPAPSPGRVPPQDAPDTARTEDATKGKTQTTLYGDRLFYRFADQNLRVYGSPRTIADAGHSISTQEEIRVYDQKHPKTGDMVRYTEMIGGSDGVHIEVVERNPGKPDEKKK